MAKEKGVKLLDLWSSPFVQRWRIALAEKEVEYESKEENLSDKSELLLKSNPIYKKAPVLIHDGKPVCESLIDVVMPGKAPILPSHDPYARAQGKARFWADFVGKKIYEGGTRLWKLKSEALEEAKEGFILILKALEAELGDKNYFDGETHISLKISLFSCMSFSLSVDIALAPFISE